MFYNEEKEVMNLRKNGGGVCERVLKRKGGLYNDTIISKSLKRLKINFMYLHYLHFL